MGLIAERVDVVKTGGTLTIEWSGQQESDVFMTGQAQTVFEGEFMTRRGRPGVADF